MGFIQNISIGGRRQMDVIRRGIADITQRANRLLTAPARSPNQSVNFSDRLNQRRLLDMARQAILDRNLDEAQALISEAGEYAPHDCVAWNLLGIVHECKSEWKLARRCYGKVVAADRSFAPGQQNLRRIYELYTFGHSSEPIAFGMTSRRWRDPDNSQTKGLVLSTPS